MFTAHFLALVLGLRRDEVLGLTWNDMDLEAAELTMSPSPRRLRHHHGYLHRSRPSRPATRLKRLGERLG
jgi:integrase